MIRSTGQFIDDLTAHYFRNIHGHLPIISRSRFQNTVIAAGVTPNADNSILLLTICLLAYIPSDPESPPQSDERAPLNANRQSLYLAAKGLLAQIQGLLPPSVSLVQANLLLAIYEYGTGSPGIGLVTMAGCARMAYAARLHDSIQQGANEGPRLELTEALNTWWGIVIYERWVFLLYFLLQITSWLIRIVRIRAFACDVSGAFEQPLCTTVPSGDARLPIERDLLDRGGLLGPDSLPDMTPVSSLTSTNVAGFGRAAQAICLLDRVIRGLKTPDINSRLLLLDGLDTAIQAFLALVMSLCLDRPAQFCAAIAIGIRALFLLHCHILDIPEQTISADSRPLEEWQKASLAALDTATTMVTDIAKCHYGSTGRGWIYDASPNHRYIVQAALKHISSRANAGGPASVQNQKVELDLYLRRIRH